jgi:hypothetical protein
MVAQLHSLISGLRRETIVGFRWDLSVETPDQNGMPSRQEFIPNAYHPRLDLTSFLKACLVLRMVSIGSAGEPATTVPAGTSRRTVAPMPTVDRFPIVTPSMLQLFGPSQAFSPTVTPAPISVHAVTIACGPICALCPT